jgi:O-acetyl-ADP-ribose deacetylase (regulator of RNase III)
MMSQRIGRSTLRLLHGDITKLEVDAIVNAANEELWPGGGVSGAIHRAGGPEIARECSRIGHTPTGKAAITTSGSLPTRFVIHAVGPVWKGGAHREAEFLASAYRSSLRLADIHGVRSIAFPSISTGIYGYPIAEAARVALSTVRDYLLPDTAIEDVTFVLFTDADLGVYEMALAQIL